MEIRMSYIYRDVYGKSHDHCTLSTFTWSTNLARQVTNRELAFVDTQNFEI